MVSENKTHVFLKECGCLAMALIDHPRNYRELGNAIRMAVKRKETYKTMETQAVREMDWICPQHKKKTKLTSDDRENK